MSAATVEIGTDERRMHVRAYNYWVSLLDGRDFPSIEDLEPGDVTDFADHSVLLDFTCGREDPALPYVGTAIRTECALDSEIATIADVPSRSLLSRLTDHYLQIIANRSPIGFEAEFAGPHGSAICYRGILMPFSSDGDTIDFIYGVINWKSAEASEHAISLAFKPAPTIQSEAATAAEFQDDGFDDAEPAPAGPVLDPDAGLADRLSAARETAESVKAGEGRTRAALYRALSLAYDFAIASRECPADYQQLLGDSGVKAQVRAPMTPVVKLVFGVDYDKSRLTEFAAALSYAGRNAIAMGGFEDFLGGQAGGLKALVAGERQARRPEVRPETRGQAARVRLRSIEPIALGDLPAGEEFALVVVRRNAAGGYDPVALVDDPALIDRAVRKTL
ncbi:MAG: hypothetical protein ABIS09_03805 [Sphingomicrobium sp.]